MMTTMMRQPSVLSKWRERLWNSRNFSTNNSKLKLNQFGEEELNLISDRLKSLPRRAYSQEGYPKRAAVLVPLTIIQEKPYIMFNLRSSLLSTHKGEVSFPGGKKDEGDKDIIACALRETEEELGINSRDIRVLGKFHDYISLGGIAVTAVIAFLPPSLLPSINPNPKEIDSVFYASLDELVDPSHFEFRPTPKRGILPFFNVKNHPQIWGLTGYILHNLLHEIFKLDIPPIPKGTVEVPPPAKL
eukprot:TRINITY_DN7353_c0_g1_i1.p1 TRINITY_DN7353_c0_g1~~TRINITY_DN7353_c0_g1_i1.p1  ORF type:complete len:245 (+),score=84.43 TRINITY_DN7353_c0_g1_i1:61-795(+)